MTTFRLSYGLTSDKGDVRETNQDAASARLFKRGENDSGLFMVADGMGGKGEGERAAQIAVETVMEVVTEAVSRDGVTVNFGEVLTGAFQKANAYIVRETPNGGATLTTALIVDEMLYIAHVGDSRAYLFANNTTARLTEDHTFSRELVRRGHVTVEELKNAVVDDVLYRALGQSEELEVDISAETLIQNSCLLLCTDGLIKWDWGILRDNDPQAACDRLVTLARERGSTDNITALVVRVGGG